VKKPLKRIHDRILRLLDSVSIEDMLEDTADDLPEELPHSLIALQALPKSAMGSPKNR